MPRRAKPISAASVVAREHPTVVNAIQPHPHPSETQNTHPRRWNSQSTSAEVRFFGKHSHVPDVVRARAPKKIGRGCVLRRRPAAAVLLRRGAFKSTGGFTIAADLGGDAEFPRLGKVGPRGAQVVTAPGYGRRPWGVVYTV